MLRRVTNLALRRGRADKEYRASAPPVQAIHPWSTESSDSSNGDSLDGICRRCSEFGPWSSTRCHHRPYRADLGREK